MSVIILPHRWNRQPPGPVEVDKSHWAGKHARFAYKGDWWADLSPYRTPITAYGSSITRGQPTTPHGIAVGHGSTGAQSAALDLAFTPWTTAPTEVSLLTIHRQTSSANQSWVGLNSGSYFSSHFPYDNAAWSNFASDYRWMGSTYLPSGKSWTDLHILGFSNKYGSKTFYWDGVLQTQETAPNSPMLPATGHILYDPQNTGFSWSAYLYLFVLFDKYFTAAEHRELYKYPWSLFVPLKRIFYSFAPAAAGGTEISVPAGSLTLTGYAPSVVETTSENIAVPAAALTLTGYAPAVNATAGENIAVPAAALTLTGYAPSVVETTSENIAVPAASLTLTGYAPDVVETTSENIAVPAGALTLTGYAPSVVETTSENISVPAGALSLTGYAPSVDVTAAGQILVPAATLTLTGYAPSVVETTSENIAVPAAALTLTGYAPDVAATAGTSIAVPAGALSLTGYAPSVVATGNIAIAVPLAQLVLAAYVPTVVDSGAQKAATATITDEGTAVIGTCDGGGSAVTVTISTGA